MRNSNNIFQYIDRYLSCILLIIITGLLLRKIHIVLITTTKLVKIIVFSEYQCKYFDFMFNYFKIKFYARFF